MVKCDDGILVPKLSYWFRVTGDKWISGLLKQIQAIDLGSEELRFLEPTHRTRKLVLWLEDDITCVVMKTIREWQARPELPKDKQFTLKVELLNGMEYPLETFTFTGCELEALQHSLLNYAEPLESIRLTTPPQPQTADEAMLGRPHQLELNGTITSNVTKPVVLKLLQVSFWAMTHEIAEKQTLHGAIV